MDNPFVVADEIVVLERQQQIIIFNAEQVNPVYFAQGGRQAHDILSKLKKIGPLSSSHLPDGCSREVFDFFRSHCLIVPQNPSRENVSRQCCRCETTDRISCVRNVYLLLTHSCNQACIYCLNGEKTYKKKHHLMMSEEVAYKSLENAMNSIADNGKLEVVFFGGEPLMNWPLAKKIIRFCKTDLAPRYSGKHISFHLTTNLSILPDDLIEVAKANRMTFLVNIDGPEEVHNRTRPLVSGECSFHTTARNLGKLTAAGLSFALRATVTSHNDALMLEIAKTHKELGGSGCAFVPLNPVDSDANPLPLELCPSPQIFAEGLREVLRSGLWPVEKLFPFNEYQGRLQPLYRNQWGCGAPFGNTPVVTSNGLIYSCIYLVGNKKYEVGNIQKNDFPRKDVLGRMLDMVNVNNREECQHCGFRYLCGGGCPVGVLSLANNPQASPELLGYVTEIACTMSKTVLDELFCDLARSHYNLRGENIGVKENLIT